MLVHLRKTVRWSVVVLFKEAQENTDFAPLPTLVEFSLSEEPADRPSSSASTRRQNKTRCVISLLHLLGDVRLVIFKSDGLEVAT